MTSNTDAYKPDLPSPAAVAKNVLGDELCNVRTPPERARWVINGGLTVMVTRFELPSKAERDEAFCRRYSLMQAGKNGGVQ